MHSRISTGLMMLALAVMVTGCQVPVVRTGIPVSHNLPPAQMLMEPGPGVGGPGPGVLSASSYAANGNANVAHGPMGSVAQQKVQILFDKPAMMNIHWDVNGVGQYDSTPLVVPGRQNFGQGCIYRLKLTNIEGQEGLELYPTLEIGTVSTRTAAYLAHSAVPIQMTQEDFDQVNAGNFVTKVIYVPDPEYQELALAGVDTLVSTRLDPGVDPITEADRRGAILAILRIGNKDLEVPGTDAAAVAGTMNGAPGVQTDGYISGVSGPSYGMPWTATQIGLPGPPHIPMGGPAGLQRYDLYNHTAMQIPNPTPSVDVHVKQNPGLSYPQPVNRVMIREQTIRPGFANGQPPADMVHGQIPYCPPQGLLHRRR
ncbi:MAG: hypothetical protein MK108_01835 [Mariniblastus sp.]|nr:hypothetical protein [Mariniblastus sp.]